MANILVTGGAGFIGSFLVDELVKQGHFVKILDSLEPQVHLNKAPDYVNKNAEFIRSDINNCDALKKSLKGIDAVFHQAALVGVGQSMYEIRKYVNANSLGTASLLNALVNENHNVKKLIVASSMSTYGEGSYKCEKCGLAEPKLRHNDQMLRKEWELKCQKCKSVLVPIPTKEEKKQEINSVYASTKKDQEDMCLMIGKAYGIPTVALRYFNVYGPRQSLSNPYTGVAAIFISRVKNNNSPVIFEDGNQTRDFISVHDVVEANLLSMEKKAANYEIFNVGTEKATSILQVAEAIISLCKSNLKTNVTEQFRKGDVRHCVADISKIKAKLGFKPKIGFKEGMKELIEWSESQESSDNVDKAMNELRKKGLL